MADNVGDAVFLGDAFNASLQWSLGVQEAMANKTTIFMMKHLVFMPAKVNKKPRHGNRSGEKSNTYEKIQNFILLPSGSLRTP